MTPLIRGKNENGRVASLERNSPSPKSCMMTRLKERILQMIKNKQWTKHKNNFRLLFRLKHSNGMWNSQEIKKWVWGFAWEILNPFALRKAEINILAFLSATGLNWLMKAAVAQTKPVQFDQGLCCWFWLYRKPQVGMEQWGLIGCIKCMGQSIPSNVWDSQCTHCPSLSMLYFKLWTFQV